MHSLLAFNDKDARQSINEIARLLHSLVRASSLHPPATIVSCLLPRSPFLQLNMPLTKIRIASYLSVTHVCSKSWSWGWESYSLFKYVGCVQAFGVVFWFFVYITRTSQFHRAASKTPIFRYTRFQPSQTVAGGREGMATQRFSGTGCPQMV